jgi:hypothetical protein
MASAISGLTLAASASRSAKPTAGRRLRQYAAPMFGDPRLGVGFGFEFADLGRKTFRDFDLNSEHPVFKRDYAIGCLGVGVSFGHFVAALIVTGLPLADAAGTRFLRRMSYKSWHRQ